MMKQCQNCKASFEIVADDLAFYQKISVPPPTWCPECRMQRRMAFRNERTLYRRTCDLCKSSIIAMYPEDAVFPVYCNDCWYSDKWDPLSYGSPYDFAAPFFAQFKRLLAAVPRLAIEAYQNENTPYSNFTWLCKNVYLSPSTLYAENVIHSRAAYHVKDAVDCSNVYHSELCYDTVIADRCSHVSHLVHCIECMDSLFLFSCTNCRNCFMSANLRHKSYVFRNRQLSKKDYEDAMRAIEFGSFKAQEELRREFHDMKTRALHRFALTKKVLNASGDNIQNAKNAFCCFDVSQSENVRYFAQGTEIKDSMDLFGAGPGGELLYEGVNVGYKDSSVFFSSHTYEGMTDVKYCDYCRNSQYLFGCVGLRKKQHCILNAQYSQGEYEKLVLKIIEQMTRVQYVDAQGRTYAYGEFFPAELSPFAYNETIAQEYFPLTKEEALAKGYRWREPETKSYVITKRPQDLPDHIKEVEDDILDDTIGCAHSTGSGQAHEGKCNEQCTTAFKIIPQELQFYRKMNISLPRLCPNCRHYERLKQRNPLKLWHRRCMCKGTTDLCLTPSLCERFSGSMGICPPIIRTARFRFTS